MSEVPPGEDASRKAYNRAIKMLADRSRSSSEIREGLAAKGFRPQTVEEVVASLQEEGLLDDAAFARDLVIHGQERHKGRERIYAELRRRGIPRATAEESIRLHFDPETERASVRELLSGALADGQVCGGETELERAVSRIARRGFSADAVNSALAEMKRAAREGG